MAGQFFISYSREDRSYVENLANFLARFSIPVWYDIEIEVGALFSERIESVIDQCVGLIVVLTPTSASSQWVRTEVLYAKNKNKPIFPLLLRSATLPIELTGLEHEDVTRGRMPGKRFVAELRDLSQLEPALREGRSQPQRPVRRPRLLRWWLIIYLYLLGWASANGIAWLSGNEVVDQDMIGQYLLLNCALLLVAPLAYVDANKTRLRWLSQEYGIRKVISRHLSQLVMIGLFSSITMATIVIIVYRAWTLIPRFRS